LLDWKITQIKKLEEANTGEAGEGGKWVRQLYMGAPPPTTPDK